MELSKERQSLYPLLTIFISDTPSPCKDLQLYACSSNSNVVGHLLLAQVWFFILYKFLN